MDINIDLEFDVFARLVGGGLINVDVNEGSADVAFSIEGIGSDCARERVSNWVLLTDIIGAVAAGEGVGGGGIKSISIGGGGIKPICIGDGVSFYSISIDEVGDGENSVEFRRNFARLDLIGGWGVLSKLDVKL